MEPEAIGFSLAAPGWTILLALLLLILLIYGILRYVRYRKNKYRREALILIQKTMESSQNANKKLYSIGQTLKQVALVSYGRAEQANLQGILWLDFLALKNKGDKVFSPEVSQLFHQSLYQGRLADISPSALDALHNESINWIKSHHV